MGNKVHDELLCRAEEVIQRIVTNIASLYKLATLDDMFLLALLGAISIGWIGLSEFVHA
jgi:hypothetical protein